MEDSSGQSLLFQSILLLILTLLTAFFSASEMALVSLNRSRVEQKAEEGDKKFIRLLKVLENPNNFLSTIQVGITFISLLQGASLSASLGAVIATWFGCLDLYLYRFWGTLSKTYRYESQGKSSHLLGTCHYCYR